MEPGAPDRNAPDRFQVFGSLKRVVKKAKRKTKRKTKKKAKRKAKRKGRKNAGMVMWARRGGRLRKQPKGRLKREQERLLGEEEVEELGSAGESNDYIRIGVQRCL